MVQQTLSDETVLAEADDGTALVLYEHLPAIYDADDTAEWLREHLDTIDRKAGAVRFRDDDGNDVRDTDYDDFRDARLAYGLWVRCGPFMQPESGRSVPVEVATDGQDSITAYVYLGNGFPLARSVVAERCGVTEQTVSDRLSRVRWHP